MWPVLSLRGRSWGLWPMISFTRCSRPWFHTDIALVEIWWEIRNKKLTKRTFFSFFFWWWFENLMAGRHQDCDALILLVDLSYKSNYANKLIKSWWILLLRIQKTNKCCWHPFSNSSYDDRSRYCPLSTTPLTSSVVTSAVQKLPTIIFFNLCFFLINFDIGDFSTVQLYARK